MAQQSSRTPVAAVFLVALVVLAAAPAASGYGCYDDCYERCGNGKQDPDCTKMCTEACGAVDKVNAAAGEASKP
jgi:hypothetical protein